MSFFLRTLLKYIFIFLPVAVYVNFKFYTYYFLFLLLCTLLYLIFYNFPTKRNFSLMWFVLPFFYLIHFLYLLNTSNIKSGLFDLEVKASLLFMPLLFYVLKNNEDFVNKTTFYFHKKVIFYASILVIIVLSVLAITNFIYENKLYLLFYVYLARVYHPSYLSLYVILGLISFFIINNKSFSSFVTIGIVFTLFVFLLLSKAGYISLILLYTFLVIYFYRHNNLKLSFCFFGLSLLLIILAFSFLYFNLMERSLFYEETVRIVKNESQDYSKVYASVPIRVLVWKTSLNVLKKNWLFGVGTGDVKDELLKKYREKNIVHALEQKLNAHNQFLETFLAQGIIGFIGLLLVFAVLFYYNFKSKNFLFLCFTLIIFINFLFESMLNTQAGVVLFSYFYVLTLINYELEKR